MGFQRSQERGPRHPNPGPQGDKPTAASKQAGRVPRGRRQARSQLGLPWTAPQAEKGQGTGLSVPTLLPRSQRLCPGDSAVGHGQRQRRVMMATAAPDAGHSLAGRRLTKLGCLACKAGRRCCRHATAGGPWAPGQAQRVGGDATARRLGQSREAGTTAAAL